MEDIDYRILGPLEIHVDGRVVEIPRARPRSLLAALLLSAGEPVSTTWLADAVWGEAAPPTAEQLIRVYVSQLRGVLGGDAIVTKAPGYAIAAGGSDASRFDQLVREARQLRENGPPAAASAAYDRALGLWRGKALADAPVEGEASIRLARLQELRLSALEERIDLALALGRHRDVVPELEALVAEEPLRERPLRQLMLALYRSGRQADALEAYRTGRRHLAEELGLSPSNELQELEAAILRQDESLAAPRRATRAARGRLGRRAALAGLVAAVVAVIAAVAVDQLRSDPAAKLEAHSVGRLDATTGSVQRALRLGGTPTAVAAGGGHVWVADSATGTLSELAGDLPRKGHTIGLRATPHRLIVGGNAVWLANGFDGTLTRVDSTGAAPPFRPEPHSIGRLALAFGSGSLWVGSQDNVVSRVDPADDGLIVRVPGIRTPEAMTYGFGAAWVAQATSVDVVRIEAHTNTIAARIPLGSPAVSAATGAHAIWALSQSAGRLWRIDPSSNAVTASVAVGADASDVVAEGREVWVASSSSGELRRIDPRTNRVAETIRLRRQLGGVSLSGGHLFVATR